MIRPENLVPFAPGKRLTKGYVGLTVRVKESAFTGQDRLTRLLEPTGREILMRRPSFEDPIGRENDEIVVGWNPEDTWKVADETAS